MKWKKTSNWYFLIGGRIEPNESSLEAASREAKEEAGFCIDKNLFTPFAVYREIRYPNTKWTDPTAKACDINTTAYFCRVTKDMKLDGTDYDSGEKDASASTKWLPFNQATTLLKKANRFVYASYFVAKIEPRILRLARKLYLK